MQHLLYVLFQLDEACRYIEDGRLERVRLALLLLDNAAEIQMDRRIRDDLSHHTLKERLRKQALIIPENERPIILQGLLQSEELTSSQKLKLDRLFDEKVNFLTEREHHLDPRLAGPLKYLHRYRNEAYHRARVRRETIRTAAIILLEINCQLLLSTRPGCFSYASDEDYSWIEQRFAINRTSLGFHRDEALPRIVDTIRSGISPDDDSVAANLADHLAGRFD